MKLTNNIKIPKQWFHWMKKAGLKWHRSSIRGKNRLWAMQGHGCYWRVNCHGHFQRSEPYEDFDRWGNSLAATIEDLPVTEKEFLDVVNLLKVCSGNTVVHRISR